MGTNFRKMSIYSYSGSLGNFPVEVDVNIDNVVYATHPTDKRFVTLHFVDGSEMHVTVLSYDRAMKGE